MGCRWKKDACFRPKAGVPLHARYAPCQQAPRDLHRFKNSCLCYFYSKRSRPPNFNSSCAAIEMKIKFQQGRLDILELPYNRRSRGTFVMRFVRMSVNLNFAVARITLASLIDLRHGLLISKIWRLEPGAMQLVKEYFATRSSIFLCGHQLRRILGQIEFPRADGA